MRRLRPLLIALALALSARPAHSLNTRGASEEQRKRPILLIHGIAETERSMRSLARYLRGQGFEVHTLSLTPNWGQCGLDELASQVSAHVERTFPAGLKIDLVGFSMGGLVSRYYLQRLGGLGRVRRFVTLSTPHQGTWLAHLVSNPGCRQMRPGSEFLEDLAADADRLQQVGFTSFWTPFDLVVLPPRSSEVSGARNVKMIVALHPLMVWAPRCHRAVAAALGA